MAFWRKCRIVLRCLRFGVWLIALVALVGCGWFNLVGLPDFLKTHLTTTLRERGVELEFSRMRLRLAHGLVAENVRLGGHNPSQPALTASEVQLRLDYAALFHRRWQVDGIVVRNGEFSLPLATTNTLTLRKLQAELRFATNEVWSLDQFRADFAGLQILLAGSVAHPLEAGHWQMFSASTGGDRGATTRSLQTFADTLAQIKFTGAPQLSVSFHGDARDMHSFVVWLNARVPDVRTPWGSARQVQAAAQLTAPADSATKADPALGYWTNVQPFRLAWILRLTDFHSEKINADELRCDGVWHAPELTITQLTEINGREKLAANARLNLATKVFSAQTAGALDPASVRPFLAASNAAGGFNQFTVEQPVAFSLTAAGILMELNSLTVTGRLAATNFTFRGQPVDRLHTHFAYAQGVCQLDDFELVQAKTRLRLAGEVNPTTKHFRADLDGDFDPESLRPFLTSSNATRGFNQFTFAQPATISLNAAGKFTELNSLAVTGRVAMTNFAFRGQSVDRLQTRFAYAQRVGQVDDFELAQAKTRLRLAGSLDVATKLFRTRLEGDFDPECLRPFLNASNAARGFSHLTFAQPAAFLLNVTGDLTNPHSLAATGRVALANCAIRGQTIDRLTADVTYSNQAMEFLHPQLSRAGGAEYFSAEKVLVDLAGEKLFIGNGTGRVTPMVVGRAIGPQTAAGMAPYQFLAVPEVRVSGWIPLKQKDGEVVQDDADLQVELVGTTPFRWRRFETPAISGTIRWVKTDLIITNAITECYGGEARGWGVFDVRPYTVGTDFQFFMTGTNVDFHRMGAALWSATNQLAGALSGTVVVTHANSDDWRTWNGYGAARLSHGLLWDVPIFGLISPAMNLLTLGLGLGNNRATEAAGNFVMTNGVIYTDSLVIQTAMARLDYVGTVDLAENVRARVTAQLLRNTPVLGSVVSLFLWPVSKAFECEVTGTLGEPKPTPLHAPAKLLLVPLHPFRTMEEIFSPAPTPTPPTQ